MGKKANSESEVDSPEARPPSAVEAEEQWRTRLAQIPLAFARMTLCARHRGADERYFDAWLAERTSPDECHRIIHECHGTAFAEWLVLPMKKRVHDLKQYLLTCSTDVISAPELSVSWVRFCRDLVPSQTSHRDLEYFTGQAETVLQILRNAHRRRHGSA